MPDRIEALEVVEGKQTVRVHYGERTHEIAIGAAETLGLHVGLEVTAAARSKFAAAQRLGRERGLRRLAGFLAQRGFNDAVVREVSLRMFAGEPAAPRPAGTARPAQKAGAWRRRPRVSEET